MMYPGGCPSPILAWEEAPLHSERDFGGNGTRIWSSRKPSRKQCLDLFVPKCRGSMVACVTQSDACLASRERTTTFRVPFLSRSFVSEGSRARPLTLLLAG